MAHICLTGFMGSGKTTVGTTLATLLGRGFVDLDHVIVQQQGTTIAEIFQSKGEQRFREAETQSLESVLQSSATPLVIALGGGTFVQEKNRALLTGYGAVTVYLSADFDVLFQRCCIEDGTRPLLQNPEQFRSLFEARLPAYRAADIIVETGPRTPEQIAQQIAAEIQAKAVPD